MDPVVLVNLQWSAYTFWLIEGWRRLHAQPHTQLHTCTHYTGGHHANDVRACVCVCVCVCVLGGR